MRVLIWLFLVIITSVVNSIFEININIEAASKIFVSVLIISLTLDIMDIYIKFKTKC